MPINCDRIIVEGSTEKAILGKLGFDEDNIEVKYGKGEVNKEFKKYLSSTPTLKKGNVCFIIDGDEEGYEGIYNELNKDINTLDSSPPYIKVCKGELCYILIVIGDKNNDFKGCIETLLLARIKVDKEVSDIINRAIEYQQQKLRKLSMCDKDKMSFYLSIFLTSGEPTLLYLSKKFVEELFKIVGENIVKDIIANFIEIK
uniref:Uncharacterized protein n=1 Tax=Saccharolobus islandicus TaxID=43080 RepID=Q5W2M7_SACIS|nr:hypothetical protein [Sulfolobus islandicus]CAG38269.1 hypothetical protein [Sulfolobus islandicus]